MLKQVLLDYNPVPFLLNKVVARVGVVAEVADYLRLLLFSKDDAVLEKLLFLLGVGALTLKAGTLLHRTASLWSWLPSHVRNATKLSASSLKARYGDCYVAITGFSDGIGMGFAQVFAEYGFNLLLIGRNQKRVEGKVAELKSTYKEIKIQHLVSDLADLGQLAQLEEQCRRFAGLDIGIVINNAGSVTGGHYVSSKAEALLNDLHVDLTAVFTLNRILIPQLRARTQRGAILNISSCTGVYLSSRLGVYSAGKRSVDVYSRILELENRDKIDVLSVRPFGVTTKMMGMKKGPFMVSPRECVLGTLADLLGGKTTTFGHFKHKLSSTIGFEPFNELQRLQLYVKLWEAARLARES